MQILGIDLGGTSIKSALVNSAGDLSNLQRTPTPQNDASGARAIDVLAALIRSYLDVAEFDAVGLCVPGIVDSENGIAKFSGTLGWRELPIANELTKLTGLPVFLEHDVTAGGIAELEVGEAKGANSAAILAIGTALAACFVIDGKVYRPHTAVGEIGHAPTPNNRPCVCGKSGCMEMTVSGGALVRNYKELTGKDATPMDILQKLATTNDAAQALRQEFYSTLGFGIQFISATLGPELVVLAGGVPDADPDFQKEVEAELDHRFSIQLRPQIRISKLEGTSGCIGAALSALKKMNSK